MAEEQVVTADASPVPSDLKRKFEDLEPEAPQQQLSEQIQHLESNANSTSEPDDGGKVDATVSPSDEGEKKRPRIEEEFDGPASKNGYQDEQAGEPLNENQKSSLENDRSQDGQLPSNEHTESVPDEQNSSRVPENAAAKESPVGDSGLQSAEEPSKETQKPSVESTEQHVSSAEQSESVDIEHNNVEVPHNKVQEAEFLSSNSKICLIQDASRGQEQPTSAAEITTLTIKVPNNKVGVLIGKAGDTIRYLQYNSGAKIQITRDADADPNSTTRPVELIGSLDSIEKAEKLINAVIAEADAGGSPALVARGLSSAQATSGSEQIQIQVPNEKVGLIIGRGGETIKGLQTKSGARIQLIPQHRAEGDDSKERTVQVTGDKRQVEIAREMIKEVMSQPVRSSTGGYSQQGYRPPRGSGGAQQWGQRSSHYGHPTTYDNQQRGPYSHNPQYAPPPYGNYAQHMAPRGNFGSGWEQRSHPNMQGPPPHSGTYDYYGGQGHISDGQPPNQHPGSVPPHGAGPSPVPSMGPPSAQASYNYGQPQGPDYGHQMPYSQSGFPQQGYGHGYDNRAPTQHPYGGHVGSQPTYPQVGTQPNYAAQQQYGKPPLYGMPAQGQPAQSYGPPRATQPGDMPYQSSTPAQSYGTNVPSQQPYPYASSGPSQAAYPTYGSAPVADGYSHLPPTSGTAYAQPGSQLSYGQPGTQQAPSYGQVAPAGGYGSYPSSQQAYAEQQPATSNAGYGYQAPQDPAAGYSSAPAPAYSAAPAAQPGYVQPAPTQTAYDQSNPQTAAYGATQAPATAAYGKTVSPQPTYPQTYDSAQAYAAPR